MDIVFEILIELYLELMFLIVPEKNVTKKHKIIAAVIALIVIAVIFAFIILGVVLIFEKNNLLGIIPLSLAIIISVVQIIFGIKLFNKNH